jgi:hypothetical protein
MRLDRPALIAFMLAGSATAASPQPQPLRPGPLPAGTALIRGTVVDDQSGEPLANVIMTLREARSLLSGATRTDTDGHYEFAGVAGGEYHLTAHNTTHQRQCHGASDVFRARCVAISVVPDQRRSGIDFRLQRGAIVRGRVVDHDGRPVAGASVSLAGEVTSGLPAKTGRDGTFELTNVAGDKLRVAVDPPASPDVPRSPPIYYPGVLDLDEAVELDLPSGSVTTGIAIVLPRNAAHSIVVRVASPASARDVIVKLIAVAPRISRRIELSAEGVGAVKGLREGRYWIAGWARSGDDALVAFDVVDIAQDSHDVSLSLQPGGRIAGRIVAERGGLPPLDGVWIGAAWVEGDTEIDPFVPDQVAASADGLFSIDGLFGTRALQLIGLAREWQVKSVLLGRSDIASTGVEVLPGTTLHVTIVVGRQ